MLMSYLTFCGIPYMVCLEWVRGRGLEDAERVENVTGTLIKY